jgi:hypothetical protein
MMMIQRDIEDLIERERQERDAAAAAKTVDARDAHFMLAERLADRAWSANEAEEDLPPIVSGLWG